MGSTNEYYPGVESVEITIRFRDGKIHTYRSEDPWDVNAEFQSHYSDYGMGFSMRPVGPTSLSWKFEGASSRMEMKQEQRDFNPGVF